MTNYNIDRLVALIETLITRNYGGYVPDESFQIHEILEDDGRIEVYGDFVLEAKGVTFKDVDLRAFLGDDLYGELEEELAPVISENGGRADVEMDLDFYTPNRENPFIFDLDEGVLYFDVHVKNRPAVLSVSSYLTFRASGHTMDIFVGDGGSAFEDNVGEGLTEDLLPNGAYISDGTLHFDPETLG